VLVLRLVVAPVGDTAAAAAVAAVLSLLLLVLPITLPNDNDFTSDGFRRNLKFREEDLLLPLLLLPPTSSSSLSYIGVVVVVVAVVVFVLVFDGEGIGDARRIGSVVVAVVSGGVVTVLLVVVGLLLFPIALPNDNDFTSDDFRRNLKVLLTVRGEGVGAVNHSMSLLLFSCLDVSMAEGGVEGCLPPLLLMVVGEESLLLIFIVFAFAFIVVAIVFIDVGVTVIICGVDEGGVER